MSGFGRSALITTLAVTLPALVGCGTEQENTVDEVIGIDVSTSSARAGLINDGIDLAADRLGELSAPARLTVIAFRRSVAATSRCEPVVVELPQRDSARARTRDAEIARARLPRQLADHLACVEAEPGERASDVLGGLTIAAGLLDRSWTTHRVWLVTDGVADSVDLRVDLDRLEDPSWVEATITGLDSAGLIPSLDAAHTTVLGIGQGTAMTGRQVIGLTRFWERLVTASHGTWTTPSANTQKKE
jgi:hypothetical protein